MEPPGKSSRSTASHTLHQYCCPTQVLDSMKLSPSGRLAESRVVAGVKQDDVCKVPEQSRLLSFILK
ncbi:IQ motif and SEC7 domain-containing protein 2 isoform X2 [Tupaia chinensis]|uniref:IQ motif and SEC7 domain-containing protein 2 isoform X2 n=1 Tax=Tupaia chinensis TaxID=246437 RepID=UPI000FFC37F3|nr:IQ motif and SEC7 domain-containing protein 2 isoform X2 [Tupaia chinensis]